MSLKPSLTKVSPFDIDAMLSREVTQPPEAPASKKIHIKIDFTGKEDGRQFSWMSELKGHGGAVYCVQYSPCGRFLASGDPRAALHSIIGSFDKTVRIWDAMLQRELRVLSGHAMAVTDLSWKFDSTLVITGM